MSLINFQSLGSEFPDGTNVNWQVRIDELKPLVSTRIGKTTVALSGNAGETRIRNRVVSGSILIPRITVSELQTARVFAASMSFGFKNLFFMNALDCPGIHRTFWGVVLEDILPIENEGCIEWSMRIPFTETNSPQF